MTTLFPSSSCRLILLTRAGSKAADFRQEHHIGFGGESGRQLQRKCPPCRGRCARSPRRPNGRLVARQSKRLAEFAEEGIHLFERVTPPREKPWPEPPARCHSAGPPSSDRNRSSVLVLPGRAASASRSLLESGARSKSVISGALGEKRQPELLGVAVGDAHAAVPTQPPPLAPGLGVFEIADDQMPWYCCRC